MGISLRNKTKTLTSYALIALMALSIALGVLASSMGAVKAQGQIIPSSNNLNPYKIIELDIRLPGVDVDRVPIRVLDAETGAVLSVYVWVKLTFQGTPSTQFYAKKLATGRYVAYLAGDQVTTAPQNPKVVLNETVSGTTYSYLSLIHI